MRFANRRHARRGPAPQRSA